MSLLKPVIIRISQPESIGGLLIMNGKPADISGYFR